MWDWLARLFAWVRGLRPPEVKAGPAFTVYSLDDDGDPVRIWRGRQRGAQKSASVSRQWPLPGGAACCQVVWGKEPLADAECVWADAGRAAAWLTAHDEDEVAVVIVRR